MLTKTRSILHISRKENAYVWFARQKDEPSERDRTLLIDMEAWRDMGSPEVITITIEPGDILNA